ncbi:hypothetical protein M2169_000049 [Streptomyces sp. MJP52]|nr:hypothetical protein [Streptomyces sp. MJP52]
MLQLTGRSEDLMVAALPQDVDLCACEPLSSCAAGVK